MPEKQVLQSGTHRAGTGAGTGFLSSLFPLRSNAATSESRGFWSEMKENHVLTQHLCYWRIVNISSTFAACAARWCPKVRPRLQFRLYVLGRGHTCHYSSALDRYTTCSMSGATRLAAACPAGPQVMRSSESTVPIAERDARAAQVQSISIAASGLMVSACCFATQVYHNSTAFFVPRRAGCCRGCGLIRAHCPRSGRETHRPGNSCTVLLCRSRLHGEKFSLSEVIEGELLGAAWTAGATLPTLSLKTALWTGFPGCRLAWDIIMLQRWYKLLG